jgi:hypothetical protein
MLTSHKLYTVRMIRRVGKLPKLYTKDVLIDAPNSTAALATAKEVHRGYKVDLVSTTNITFWRLR